MKLRWDLADTAIVVISSFMGVFATLGTTPFLCPFFSIWFGFAMARCWCRGNITTSIAIDVTIGVSAGGWLAFALIWKAAIGYPSWSYPLCLMAGLWFGFGLGIFVRWLEVRRYRKQAERIDSTRLIGD